MVKRIYRVLLTTFYDFAEMSKINGMYYLTRGATEGYVRLGWALFMLAMVLFGAVLSVLAWIKFVSFPTQLTIEESMDIGNIPFPAITVCHPQSVVDYQVQKFIERIEIPEGSTKEEVADKLIVLSMFTEYQWERPHDSDVKLIDSVLNLNNITVPRAIDALGFSCKDLLLRCFFLGVEFPCFQNSSFLSWNPSYSFLGACCSFNYYPELYDDNYFKVNYIGISNSLTLLLTGGSQISDGKSGSLYSDGLVLLVHHPRDYAIQEDSTVLLQQGFEKFVEIFPTALTCSDETMRLPVKQRTCMIPDDIDSVQYRQPECELSCKRRLVHKKCGCHPYHLPEERTWRPIRDCTAKDVTCFVDNYLEFNTVRCPECLPPCFNFRYDVRSFKARINAHNVSFADKYRIVKSPQTQMMATIYWSKQRVTHNKRIIIVSLIQLLANLGGAFNLVFGMSIISVFEVIYVLTVRLWKHWREQKRLEKVNFIVVKNYQKN